MATSTGSDEGFLRTLERRLATAAPMALPEHDALMTAMFLEAQRSLPPLAFHAWVACSFAARRGLLSDVELDALGEDPYTVLFALQERGVLAALERAVHVPQPRKRGEPEE